MTSSSVRESSSLDQMNSTEPNLERASDSNILIKAGTVATDENLSKQPAEVTDFLDSATSTRVKMCGPTIDVSVLDRFEKMEFSKWFSIPYEIANFQWTSTDERASLLSQIVLPDFLFSKPLFYNKLLSFRYFHSDFKLSFRINGTAMHYGELLVVNVPYPAGMDTNPASGDLSKHLNYYSLSNAPNMCLSPTENSTHFLHVPWTLPSFWIDLDMEKQDFTYNNSNVLIFVLNPLSSLNDPVTPVSVSVFLECVNPVFSVLNASTTPYTPLGPSDWDLTFPSTKLNILDSSTLKVCDIESQGIGEAFQKAIHGVEAGVKMATEVATAAVRTGASIVDGVAMLSGKPDTLRTPNHMNRAFENVSTVVGTDLSRPLALIPDNAVKYLPSCISQTAEDSLSSLCQMNSLFDQIEIQRDSTGLFAYPVTPMTYRYSNPTETSNNVYHTNLSYLSSAFLFWTGTIVYKFQFVSSQFHSCRVRFYWSQNGKLSNDESAVTYNKVIDIQMNTEFEVAIPYYGLGPQRRCSASDFNGYLCATVVNPLTAGLTAGDPIPPIAMNCWIRAGGDFALYRPRGGLLTTLAPIASQADFSALESDTVTFDGFTIGEGQVTASALARRPGFVSMVDKSTIYRWWGQSDSQNPSFLRYLAGMYRFWRGSVRLKFLAAKSLVARIRNVNGIFEGGPILLDAVTDDRGLQGGFQLVPTGISALGAVTIPFYTNRYMFPTNQDEDLYLPGRTGQAPGVLLEGPSTTIPFDLYESAGDDFQYLVPIGAPAVHYAAPSLMDSLEIV